MNTREFFLRLAIFQILVFSASAHAVPILHVNITSPVGEIHFPKHNDFGMDRPEADGTLIRVNSLWNGDVGKDNLLSGDYSSGFTTPYDFDSIFTARLLGSNLASLTILDIFTADTTADTTQLNGDIESSGDTDDIANFLATLGITMEDWLATEENPHANSQSDQSAPASFIPAITRYSLGNDCLQQRPGLRQNLCPQGGGSAGTGGRGGVGTIPGMGGGGSGLGGSGNGFNPGIGGIGGAGSGIGGNGPGTGNLDVDNGDPDIGGNGPGTGGGSGGDGGNVVTVPEPTTLALIGFGIASICTVRRRRK